MFCFVISRKNCFKQLLCVISCILILGCNQKDKDALVKDYIRDERKCIKKYQYGNIKEAKKAMHGLILLGLKYKKLGAPIRINNILLLAKARLYHINIRLRNSEKAEKCIIDIKKLLREKGGKPDEFQKVLDFVNRLDKNMDPKPKWRNYKKDRKN